MRTFLSPLQGDNLTAYIVRVVGSDTSVGQGCTVCTSSPCLYVHQVTHVTNNYSIFVTSINGDGTLGPQNSTAIYGMFMGCKYVVHKLHYMLSYMID